MRIHAKDTPFTFRWIGDMWFWYDNQTKKYCCTNILESTFIPKEIDNNGKQISSKNYKFSRKPN